MPHWHSSRLLIAVRRVTASITIRLDTQVNLLAIAVSVRYTTHNQRGGGIAGPIRRRSCSRHAVGTSPGHRSIRS
jgi:hypothetical protein